MTPPRPVVLAILDGFGEAAPGPHNAVSQARTPTLDHLRRAFPHGLLNASERHVGLPEGQMGNSEVGHMSIGSGRAVLQDLPRIDDAIARGDLARNPMLKDYLLALKASGSTCHLMGLLSPGGVHSHQNHLAALARRVLEARVPLRVHAFLDGRDTPPKSALAFVAEFQAACPKALFATVSGRYYAMDRDRRGERTELTYRAIAEGRGDRASDIASAILAGYEQGVTDEFLKPCVLDGYAGMKEGDGILMANFRADRVRQILTALLDPGFTEFARPNLRLAAALGMAEYSAELAPRMGSLMSGEKLTNILGQVLERAGKRQLRLAETEKYAHVTFFFNGGREEPFQGETRILVPSPKVATYDLKPEMSAEEVTGRLVEAIAGRAYDFIVVNYANTDMVGHTGDLKAAVRAVETVDACLTRVWEAVQSQGGALIVTADHGNVEAMHDPSTAQAHTAHTLNPVPVIVAAPGLEGKNGPLPGGTLADIAPTILQLMGLEIPKEMTGRFLFQA